MSFMDIAKNLLNVKSISEINLNDHKRKFFLNFLCPLISCHDRNAIQRRVIALKFSKRRVICVYKFHGGKKSFHLEKYGRKSHLYVTFFISKGGSRTGAPGAPPPPLPRFEKNYGFVFVNFDCIYKHAYIL